MPRSSTASSSYLTESCDETTASSGSVIELSSDSSRSAEDAGMSLRPANQTHPHTNPEVITLSDSSSCESHLSNTSEEYKHESLTEGMLDEPHPLKRDVKCQKSSLGEAGSATEERGKDLQELKNTDFKTEKGNSGEDHSTRGVTSIYCNFTTHWVTMGCDWFSLRALTHLAETLNTWFELQWERCLPLYYWPSLGEGFSKNGTQNIKCINISTI